MHSICKDPEESNDLNGNIPGELFKICWDGVDEELIVGTGSKGKGIEMHKKMMTGGKGSLEVIKGADRIHGAVVGSLLF